MTKMTSPSSAVYQVRARQAWTGDSTGREWKLGWSVYRDAPDVFSLYEDDGRGNGDYVDSFSTVREAAVTADRHAAAADGSNDLQPFFPVHGA